MSRVDPNDNPRVNRHLKDLSFDHIDHALGRPAWPMRESYRNYFAACADSNLARLFSSSPHWRAGPVGSDGLLFFQVTPAGRAALADYLRQLGADRVYVVTFGGHERNVPASTPAKARYAYWLEISDCLADMRFGDFIRRSRVRVAA